MQAFRILEHPADVGFEAFGARREEAFENAARALMHLIADLDSVETTEEVSIEVEGPDAASLLVNWLSEVLYLHDAERWLFRDFKVKGIRDHSLSAIARGEKFDSARHVIRLQVKAITYHQLKLEERSGCWRAQVYVDI